MNLTPTEIRVLGALLEKSLTTPDQYPLSLNGLSNACNQKTNRDPVMNLSENTVLEAVESLSRQGWVSQKSGAGSRVPKYAHRLGNRLREEDDFSTAEQAILSVLMLRGAQTTGELRIRCGRLHEFHDLAELEGALDGLAARASGACVVKLARQPGQKEARYAHLFAGDVADDVAVVANSHSGELDDEQVRLIDLERKVATLERELASVRERLDTFIRQFE